MALRVKTTRGYVQADFVPNHTGPVNEREFKRAVQPTDGPKAATGGQRCCSPAAIARERETFHCLCFAHFHRRLGSPGRRGLAGPAPSAFRAVPARAAASRCDCARCRRRVRAYRREVPRAVDAEPQLCPLQLTSSTSRLPHARSGTTAVRADGSPVHAGASLPRVAAAQ